MTKELILLQAVETAWSVYLATHCDVDIADQRRCSLRDISKSECKLAKTIQKNSPAAASRILTEFPATFGDRFHQ